MQHQILVLGVSVIVDVPWCAWGEGVSVVYSVERFHLRIVLLRHQDSIPLGLALSLSAPPGESVPK